VAWLEVDLDAVLASPRGGSAYRPVSRYPSSDIDLAFEVDEGVPAADVERALAGAAADLVASVRLFDVYRGEQVGEGRRSLAFAVRLQASDRTLTDEDVAEARRRLIDAVEGALPASLRG
jgi:phenylalanyl-tRNA synthetase beta chain